MGTGRLQQSCYATKRSKTVLRWLAISFPAILLVVAPNCASQPTRSDHASPPPSAEPSGEGKNWRRIDLEAFSVTAPGPLESSLTVTPSPSGDISVHSAGYFDFARDLRYAVVYIDLPGSLAEVVDRRAEAEKSMWAALAQGRAPTMTQTDEIRAGDLPGRQHRLTFGDDSVGVVRQFWVGDSLFLVSVVGPAIPDWTKPFLESFRIRSSWKKAKSPSGLFEVEVPRGSNHQISNNTTTCLHQFLIAGKELCRVFETIVDAPGKVPLSVLDPMRKALAKGMTVVSDFPLSKMSQEGFELHTIRPSTKRHERVRLLVGSRRIYVLGAESSEQGAISHDAQRCLDSFHTLPDESTKPR